MGRKKVDPNIPLYIERVLLEYSSEEHPLSVAQIAELIEQLYEVEASKDKVRDTLDALVASQCKPQGDSLRQLKEERFVAKGGKDDEVDKILGEQFADLCTEKSCDIYWDYKNVQPTGQVAKANCKKVYWASPNHIDLQDVIMLLQPIHDSNAQAQTLEKAVLRSLNRFERAEVVKRLRSQSPSQRLCVNLDDTRKKLIRIYDLLEQGKLVSFKYENRNENGVRVWEPYREALPLHIDYSDGYYYLIIEAQSPGHRFKALRMDRIDENTIEASSMCSYDHDRLSKLHNDAKQYWDSAVNRMPSETPVTAVLRCSNDKAKYVFDNFGNRKGFRAQGRGEYVIPNVSLEGMAAWVLRFPSHIEVVGPPELRAKVVETLKANVYGLRFVDEGTAHNENAGL